MTAYLQQQQQQKQTWEESTATTTPPHLPGNCIPTLPLNSTLPPQTHTHPAHAPPKASQHTPDHSHSHPPASS